MYNGNVMNDLTINELDVGMSTEGVSGIIHVIDEVSHYLNEDVLGDPFNTMTKAIQTGWQGASCEAFLANYKNACTQILESLNQELLETKHNIGLLRDNYFDQDQTMAAEMMNEFGGGN